MKRPPLLLGAALAFWAWQTGFWLAGIVMALILESAWRIKVRWEFSENDFRRIWDFCAVLFVLAALFAFTSNETPGAVLNFFQHATPGAQRRAMDQTALAALGLFRWLPLVFFLLVAAQAYSTTERIPWTVVSWILRRRQASSPSIEAAGSHGLNTTYPYFSLCLVGASIANEPGWVFYLGTGGLLAWALWPYRPRRYRMPVWISLMGVTLILGFLVQAGFVAATRWANLRSAQWLSQYFTGGFNPKETRTALGEIGRIKLSGQIMLRVRSTNGPPPALLREASFQLFRSPDWIGAGKGSDFGLVQPDSEPTRWEFVATNQALGPVTIAQYLTERGEDVRRGVLALPQGIVRLENLPAFLVSTNPLGVVRVDEGPGLVIHNAYYLEGSTIDVPPVKRDDDIPHKESAVLSNIVEQLDLAEATPRQVLERISAHFRRDFRYSVWLPPAHRGQTNLTVLGNFLLHDRAGHCEYFATAATLLLRQAGVPARYAVGYAVQEKSGDEYLVRQRHAHAWCLAWVEGRWEDFDVTPPSWFDTEAGHASWFEGVSDFFSRLRFEFSKWRWGQIALRPYLLWFMIPVLGLLLIRFFWRQQWKQFRQDRQQRKAAALLPGADSEFYAIERELLRMGWPRQPHETLSHWLRRLEDAPALAGVQKPLREMLKLHYRFRFDPHGLELPEREALRRGVEECRARLGSERV